MDEGVTQAHQEAVDFYKNAFPNAIDTASSALSQFANDVVRGNATMEDAWSALGNTISDVVGDILQDLTKMYLKMAIMGLADALIGSFSGGFNVGGGIGTSTASVAPSGAAGLHYSVGHAKGGWYENSPSLSAYSNGVYDKPHYFAFAQGGVFGEAGPEAIMPLKRGADGSLGVRASAGAVNIIVNNHAPNTKATATSRDDGRGGKSIEVVIDEIGGKNLARHGSASDRALRSRYNLSPALTGR